ncbi:2-polyprenyl-3-methyl-6-methoxy-1,4-benzoquinone monooxygenase [Pollutimonas sp. M17]|uniref:2-polyprenyl-3-methyl-6-methoxy-1,4-benzoquinone monooxygenase n=1 Tax=Pollutimonas sp. M17 TaxID=2962065 RepID=UPI0021F4B288|nr:2-polyprenyl-3-methyl-6-methoxy-1,4-benzoquinone monooxygenase [Pollutimonas sp. M17]UYO93069.1 2-polyprenyl-3-methyl-6-methoxy-1,4-benzoquinone monooxygenase [Pollutimonas sp. M17]HWK72500.1 2-polyprenyl-3-methyl-6-methoxy-1,4-benzoquinone monooxygenase [Burkholderiaceae bacterium]
MDKPSTLPTPSGFSRRMSVLDRIFSELGRAVQVLDGSVHAGRPNPAGKPPLSADESAALSQAEQKHAAGLMRVNHVGEICAQALYRGQALFCRDASIRQVLHRAAAEEVDHLVWCRDRLHELQSRPSLLNPLWYAGSFSLGVLASRAGVGKNLGFMAETEKQVEQHLDRHLSDLPAADTRSRDIVTQMRDDEISHRNTAETHGAHKLPKPVQLAMKAMSKVMTTTAYRL